MGVEGTLHRISAIRNRDKQRSVIGLTYRVGRHMPGLPPRIPCHLCCAALHNEETFISCQVMTLD